MEPRRTIIDRETVQKIIDTADIVEVVSDFVHLKRRGANYIGLCPFHNERTPSFSVSKSKGICKCFSCGKGGSPVNFIMEHEQMTYWEALRYLAKKYHIEIRERELSDEERLAQTRRQTLLGVNEFAMKHFEKNLLETADGKEIGLSYFRERGINDWAISRFHLGYSLDKRDDLLNAAKAEGYDEEALIETGLCMKPEQGTPRDRFRARVMFPIFTISGKVVAFGGRTLRKDKEVAKYVNSPESSIYSKSHELYGLYQAKQAIVKKEKCILVEGYMDVISMHQSGIENVVASSGTSLTEGQIRLIHRFTENVTLIYDSDAAGIKASMRGIDMLLAEGLSIKVLLLPEGDDPDSFAQSHSSSEVERYIQENEVDFLKFKTKILLQDSGSDPIQRSKAISNIVRSISVIPDEITRLVYIKECSLSFGIEERALTRQVMRDIAARREQEATARKRANAIGSIDNPPQADEPHGDTPGTPATPQQTPEKKEQAPASALPPHAATVKPQELALLRLALKFGMLDLGADFADADGTPVKVIDFINEDLTQDEMVFLNPLYARIFQEALAIRNNWDSESAVHTQQAAANREAALQAGISDIQRQASDLSEIKLLEQKLRTRVDADYFAELKEFAMNYLVRHLVSSPDDVIRRAVTDIVVEKHKLSKIYFKNNTKVETEEDRLDDLVPRALLTLKYDLTRCHFEDIRRELAQLQATPGYDFERAIELMTLQKKYQALCSCIAEHIGERVYEPLR